MVSGKLRRGQRENPPRHGRTRTWRGHPRRSTRHPPESLESPIGMMRRYTLAPEAARDLVQIWRYLLKESSRETADRVESVIRDKFKYLAEFPLAGHYRRD